MAKPKGMNEKKAKGLELKATNKAAKEAKKKELHEKELAAEWKKGANNRGAERSAATAQKADEQARKKAEKAALLAAEDAANEGASSSKVRKALAPKSKKKKPQNSLSLLEESLVGDADKKVKAAKRAERLKKESEERARLERERKKAEASKANGDPLLSNTDTMIGNSLDFDGELNADINKQIDGSGIDSAISALSMGGGKEDEHPEKRMKALHKAFEERMMPEMRQQYPGLKRSQYLEKIFVLWKKSPENPMNWPKTQT